MDTDQQSKTDAMHNETIRQEQSGGEGGQSRVGNGPSDTVGSRELVLGIDGGGTKTACVILNAQQTILAQVRVGSCNRNSVGDAQAHANLSQGISSVLQAAGCDRSAIAAACIGMAGIDRPNERALVSGWLDGLLPGVPVTLYNDALIALASGTNGDLCGVAVVSGTGMIVY
ncbi:MAG TPA: BadF/BadG/BcrA/BcrD ATPase family protein, partial [Caldilineaceae bacterium]|nr:BadF/BadG/BcrA/BcrD ATPase family protein [Caldilineaceae bacterium]